MNYDIEVRTSIYRIVDGKKKAFWEDVMCWYDVTPSTLDWFANSCKAALSWYVNYPETVSEHDYYYVVYSTIIYDEFGEEMPSSVHNARLDKLDYSGVCSFQRFAIEQLQELQQHFITIRKNSGMYETKERSRLGALLGVVWSILRNKE